jgi:hypothetical protein
MSDVDKLGEIPIYRYDPKASKAEEEDMLAEGQMFFWANSDGEIVGTGIVGPRMKIEGIDGWSITVPEGDE